MLILGGISFQQVSAQPKYIYYIYVDPIPSYATNYVSSVIPNAIADWEKSNPQLKFYLTDNFRNANFEIQWIKDYGNVGNTMGEYVTGSPLIQVGLGDSNCFGQWEPYSTATITHIAEHEIGHWLGLPHNPDPNNLMFATSTVQYGSFTQSKTITTGTWTIFLTCNSAKSVTYDYRVETDNLAVPFNVYFAPSGSELQASMNQPFSYYTDNGCFAQNVNSFNGHCTVPANNILLVNPQKSSLDSSVTVYVYMQGTSSYPQSTIPVLPHGAVPEFSSVTGMVIVISIIGLVIISKRSTVHFS